MNRIDYAKVAQVKRRQYPISNHECAAAILVDHDKKPAAPSGAKDRDQHFPATPCADRVSETCLDAIKFEQAAHRADEELFRLFSDFQEDERRRIASDLHDSIGASLTVVKFHLEAAVGRLGARQVPLAELRPLHEAGTALKRTIEEVRRIAMNLKPAILDDLGLIPAIHSYCRELAACRCTLTIEESVRIKETDIPMALKTPVFRILQEAANNAIKHSGASLLRVTIAHTDGAICLSVEDNGCGFDPKVMRPKEGRAKYGLVGMQHRVKCSGGNLTITSSPGEGTRIIADWPLGAD